MRTRTSTGEPFRSTRPRTPETGRCRSVAGLRRSDIVAGPPVPRRRATGSQRPGHSSRSRFSAPWHDNVYAVMDAHNSDLASRSIVPGAFSPVVPSPLLQPPPARRPARIERCRHTSPERHSSDVPAVWSRWRRPAIVYGKWMAWTIRDWPRRQSPAVEKRLGALGQVLHGEVHAGQVAAIDGQVPGHRRPGREQQGVALLAQQVDAPQHGSLVELHVGDAVHEQPAGAVFALVDGDVAAHRASTPPR